MSEYQRQQRTAGLMRRLYGLWQDRGLDDSRHYETGNLYSPHVLMSEGEELPRQSLRGLLDRGWLQMTKEPRAPDQAPHGTLTLTDEGRDIVLALRAADAETPRTQG